MLNFCSINKIGGTKNRYDLIFECRILTVRSRDVFSALAYSTFNGIILDKRKILMSLETVTAGLREKVGSDCGLGASVKFDFGDDGCLFLDATQSPNVINNENEDAQCTMIISLENFMEMASGNLDGTAAFMSGKLRIDGDMSIAMKLGPILA